MKSIAQYLVDRIRRSLVIAGIASSLALTGCAADGSPDIGKITQGAEAVLGGAANGGLSTADIVRGLKAALETGSNTVVSQLGASGGFNNDAAIRIPLPRSLQKARDIAGKVGLNGQFDDLETRLNRAAELATPKAKALFVGAIRDMSVDDARGILNGPDNAATTYFNNKTGSQLQAAMRPLIDDALSQVGAVNSFNTLLSRYRKIPGAPPVDADLTGHVAGKGSDGIFYYLAQEEKAIRENPAKRTSEILQRVFGSL